jgi:hypothetical protein
MIRNRWLPIAGAALSAAAVTLVQGDARAAASAAEAPGFGLVFQHSSMWGTLGGTLANPVPLALVNPISGDVWVIRDSSRNTVHVRIRAEGLEPGHVYSTIFFGFNDPAACVSPQGPSPCWSFDLLSNPAAEATSFRVAAKIADEKGRLDESLYVRGDEAPSLVVFGSGFVDYGVASLNVALRDQGPAQSDPELLALQLSNPNSNCLQTPLGIGLGNGTYDCSLPQIAIFAAPGGPQPGQPWPRQ